MLFSPLIPEERTLRDQKDVLLICHAVTSYVCISVTVYAQSELPTGKPL
jgi:hypothetical protein